jgi:mannose-6-phosphate isomerase-like protein (cupin superfamily)
VPARLTVREFSGFPTGVFAWFAGLEDERDAHPQYELAHLVCSGFVHDDRDRRRGANSSVCQTPGMDDKINLAEKLALLDGSYVPGIVGYMNDCKLVVVKVDGEFVWHKHDETDDFFLVLSGRLTIQLRDRDVVLHPGELFVVPRGVEHCPKAEEETHVLLIEPSGTVNTGDAGGDLTAEPLHI